jgi:hypothetical protein
MIKNDFVDLSDPDVIDATFLGDTSAEDGEDFKSTFGEMLFYEAESATKTMAQAPKSPADRAVLFPVHFFKALLTRMTDPDSQGMKDRPDEQSTRNALDFSLRLLYGYEHMTGRALDEDNRPLGAHESMGRRKLSGIDNDAQAAKFVRDLVEREQSDYTNKVSWMAEDHFRTPARDEREKREARTVTQKSPRQIVR